MKIKDIKKIAVVFFGQPRQLEIGSKFIKPFFDFSDAGIQTDYFVHSWDRVDPKTEFTNFPENHPSQERLETSTLEESFRDIYNPRVLKIQDPSSDLYYGYCVRKFMGLLQEWKSDKSNSSPGDFCDGEDVYNLPEEWQHSYKFLLMPGWTAHKIVQFISSQKAIREKIRYQKENNIQYDLTFRLRTDIAFTHSKLEDRLEFLRKNIEVSFGWPSDKNVMVKFLHFPNGTPVVSDQVLWGESDSVDILYNSCVRSAYDYIKNHLIKIRDGFFSREPPKHQHMHVETITCSCAEKTCISLKPYRFHNEVGAFELIRDSVNDKDTFQDIARKSKEYRESPYITAVEEREEVKDE